MLYLTFHISQPVVATIKSWQQQTNQEVLRWQLGQRGQARASRLIGDAGELDIDALPEPFEAEPAYGPAGAYAFTFSPAPDGCRVTVSNLAAGDATIYAGALEPLALSLDHCLHIEEDPNRPQDAFRWRTPQYRGALPAGGGQTGVEEIVFWIDGLLMRRLEEAGWTPERAGAYDYSFRPNAEGAGVWVTHRENGAIIQLVAGAPVSS